MNFSYENYESRTFSQQPYEVQGMNCKIVFVIS